MSKIMYVNDAVCRREGDRITVEAVELEPDGVDSVTLVFSFEDAAQLSLEMVAVCGVVAAERKAA